MQNVDLVRERDSLRLGIYSLRDQLKACAESAESQQAKLLQEVQQLSQQQQSHDGATTSANMSPAWAQDEAADPMTGKEVLEDLVSPMSLLETEKQRAGHAQAEAASACSGLDAHIRRLTDGPANPVGNLYLQPLP